MDRDFELSDKGVEKMDLISQTSKKIKKAKKRKNSKKKNGKKKRQKNPELENLKKYWLPG
jgi:hypothetical protein